MQFSIFSVVALVSFIASSDSGVPADRYVETEDNDGLGLYGPEDKVIEITSSSLEAQVHNRKYATLLEFYNSFCGHCKRFAPKYIQLAEDLWPWRNVVKVMAIDCAADENNDICRTYEVMAYPTLRYFPPDYEKKKRQIGIRFNSLKPDSIKDELVRHVMNETKVSDTWPDFDSLSDPDKSQLFSGLPDAVQYVVIILEPENSTIAGEMILQFNRVQAIRIRRVTSPEVGKAFALDKFGDIAVVDRNSNLEKLSVAVTDRDSFRSELAKFLKSRNLHEVSTADETNAEEAHHAATEFNAATILEEVKRSRPAIYLADLENALWYSIMHEIPKFAEISGERLLALQRYISVVKRYNPLGENGQKFLQEVSDYIMMHNQEITGEELENKLKQIEAQHSPILSTSNWVGCLPSKRGLRGFTCGLWQLFHFMTVTAAEEDKSSDPLEVLQAIHGYVKHFFGCTDCSSHFQEMAARRNIWSTQSKNDAVLWLWSAHNEVNQRLAGDETEDPEFPKVQFPLKTYCSECYQDPLANNKMGDSSWNRDEVLVFLKRVYALRNLNRFGVASAESPPPTADKQKHTIRNVFSDMDMRMGILLYLFCIGMMVIAVKLFLYRGYRKKIYTHDFLGKV